MFMDMFKKNKGKPSKKGQSAKDDIRAGEAEDKSERDTGKEK